MLIKPGPSKSAGPPKPVEPMVHQWGYERVQSEITPTLKPRPQSWGYGVAAVLFAALIAAGFQIIRENPGGAVGVFVGSVLVCSLIAASGIRARERSALSDRAAEDIAVLVSTYLTRRCLKVTRWTGGWWVGHPARVAVRYAQGAADNLTLKQDLVDRLSGRFGVGYQVRRDVPRKRFVTFELAPVQEVVQEDVPDPLAQRVNKVVTKLFSSPNAELPSIDLDWEGEKLSRIHVRHDIGYNLTGAMVRKDRAHKLSVMLPGRWKVDWDTEGDTATFTVRPDLPVMISHPPIPLVTGTPQENYHSEYRYGIDESGEHMAWRPWLDPMMMIVGKTGRGKTVVAHSILTELAARGWLIDISDAKLIEFIGYKSWPNVRCVGAVLEEQVRLVHAALDLMQERYQQIVEGTASEEDFQPYCLFLDEYALFREDLADWYADIKRQGEPAKVPTSRKVNAVLRAGRTARVHIVLLTQRPDAEVLGSGEPRLNLSCRVSMGALDMDGARMMWGSPSVGVAVPTNIRGRGVTRNEAGEVVDFQAYWTPDPRKNTSVEDRAILDGLRPAQDLHGKLQIIQPKPMVSDKGDGELLLPSYGEYAAARMILLGEGGNDGGDMPGAWDEDDVVQGELVQLVPKNDRAAGNSAGGCRLRESEYSVLKLVRAGDDEPAVAEGPATEVRGSVGHTRTEDPRNSAAELRISQRLEDEDNDQAGGDDDDFGPTTSVVIESIEPGTRVLVDESAGVWAVVADSMADEVEEDCWVLSCITDDGADEAFVATHGELMTVRIPN